MRAFAAASMLWASDSSRAREESKMTYRLPLFGGRGGCRYPSLSRFPFFSNFYSNEASDSKIYTKKEMPEDIS